MNQKGFTLIELLVVLAIIGMLAAVGVVGYAGFIKKTEDTMCAKKHKEAVRYIKTELSKCSMGFEIESIVLGTTRSEDYPSLNTNKSCSDPYSSYNSGGLHQKFQDMTHAITNYMIGFGHEKGWSNPYQLYNQKSGITSNWNCPIPEAFGETNCNYKPTSISSGYVVCCSLCEGNEIKDNINNSFFY